MVLKRFLEDFYLISKGTVRIEKKTRISNRFQDINSLNFLEIVTRKWKQVKKSKKKTEQDKERNKTRKQTRKKEQTSQIIYSN